ncbi:MAG TPA: oligoendopeptidase F, partial [Spirochaetota bacterium]|nr:oligoendopeptidase F [Spirochaetota bacterium]
MSKKRDEIQKEDKWNVEAIFENDTQWDNEYNSLKNDIKIIASFKGKLKDGYKNLLELIQTEIDLSRRLGKLYTYAHMKHDEDGKNEKYKDYFDRAFNLSSDFDELSSFINPEII